MSLCDTRAENYLKKFSRRDRIIICIILLFRPLVLSTTTAECVDVGLLHSPIIVQKEKRCPRRGKRKKPRRPGRFISNSEKPIHPRPHVRQLENFLSRDVSLTKTQTVKSTLNPHDVLYNSAYLRSVEPILCC